MRLFVGVDCSPHTDDLRLIQQSLPPVTHKEEQFHLTLKFLGEIPKQKLSSVIAQLNRIVHPKFDLEIDHMGRFSAPTGHSVVWVGPRYNEHLASLQSLINRVTPDTPDTFPRFVPHVTLGKIPSGVKSAKRSKIPTNIKVPVKSFYLYESKPSNYKKRYKKIYQFDLH